MVTECERGKQDNSGKEDNKATYMQGVTECGKENIKEKERKRTGIKKTEGNTKIWICFALLSVCWQNEEERMKIWRNKNCINIIYNK